MATFYGDIMVHSAPREYKEKSAFVYYDRWLEASKASAADAHLAGVKVVVGTDNYRSLLFEGVR
jgi:hypothetical protein